MMKGECRYVWKHGIPKSWGEWDTQGNWWPRTRRVSVTLRKMVKREVCFPGGVGYVGKATVKGASNNPNSHTCPSQHSPGRAEEADPKYRRKAAQTEQPPENKTGILYCPQKEKGRAVTFSGLQGHFSRWEGLKAIILYNSFCPCPNSHHRYLSDNPVCTHHRFGAYVQCSCWVCLSHECCRAFQDWHVTKVKQKQARATVFAVGWGCAIL